MKRVIAICAVWTASFLLGWGFQTPALARPAIFARAIPIATSAAQERLAALGVNNRGEYLVVWEVDAGGGNFDVWGRLYAATGQPLSHAFAIAATPRPEFGARIAYNALDDEFLVVYEDGYPSHEHDIRGRRVRSDPAGPVGDPLGIGITTGDERWPDVAFSSTAGHYLVAYVLDGDIWARRIARPGQGDTGGEFLGDEFPVAADPRSVETTPAVAAAIHEGYFLVAYVYTFSEGDDDVLAQRVQATAPEAAPLLGNHFTLAASLEKEHAPALAYSPQAHAFILLWQVSIPFSEDVMGRWVDAKDLSSKPFLGESFAVAGDPVAMERFPQVDIDAQLNQVVVVLAWAPSPGDWYRPGVVRLRGDPHASEHFLAPLHPLPEQAGHVLVPRVKLTPGRTQFLQGITIQWGTSPDADTDAFLYLTDRWSLMAPLWLQ